MATHHNTSRATRARPYIIAVAVSSAVHARAEDILRRYEAEVGVNGHGDLEAGNLLLDEWHDLVSGAALDAWESCDYAGWWWSPWWRLQRLWAVLDWREDLARLLRL